MKIDINIYVKNKLTGETNVCKETGFLNDKTGKFEDYLWSEGNFACDCNRAYLLYGYNYDTSNGRFDCKTDIIEITKIVDKDNNILYED